MKLLRLGLPSLSALILSVAVTAAIPAHADTISWATWSSVTPGNPGSATGTIAPGITVTYSGQTDALLVGYPSWTPSTSYTSSVIGNAPPADRNAVKLEGGSSITETITFSSALTNPVLAIWSLGENNDPTAFDFTASEPFTIVAGGPSTEYNGGSITQSGDNVIGVEGNGVIQFNGTFTSITFTTPDYENYYAFTVGADSSPSSTSPVPEPGALSLVGLGLAALPFARRSLSRLRAN